MSGCGQCVNIYFFRFCLAILWHKVLEALLRTTLCLHIARIYGGFGVRF